MRENNKERIVLPERKVQYGSELAYKLAQEMLGAIADIEQQCRRSGAECSPAGNIITLRHLNREYQIGFPRGDVSLAGGGEAVPLRDKILVLHYFIRSKGTPLTGKIITYKELQEGINYYPTFFKRAINPIVENFKDKPGKLPEAARTLGGRLAEYGDIAVTIDAFPRVPVTIVLWSGDAEFAPDGNIMFDSTIVDYLPTEDITILCEIIAWKLVRLAKTGGDTPG